MLEVSWKGVFLEVRLIGTDKSLGKNALCFVGWCCTFVVVGSIALLVGNGLTQRSDNVQAVATDTEYRPGLITSSPKASAMWNDFSKRNNYRIARVHDFLLPAEHFRVYGDGDFNGDQIYNDFAVIAVDNTRTDASRFALVVFNSRKDSKGYDGPFWVYRGVDLSRTSLSLISHGPLIVTENRSDTETTACIVRWNRSRKTYRCEATP